VASNTQAEHRAAQHGCPRHVGLGIFDILDDPGPVNLSQGRQRSREKIRVFSTPAGDDVAAFRVSLAGRAGVHHIILVTVCG
jgi:hypothetical protein